MRRSRVHMMLVGTLCLGLMGCNGVFGKDKPVEPLPAPCPPRALADVPAEPLAPKDAELNPSAERWLFGELLPWARLNAEARKDTKLECERRLQPQDVKSQS